MSGSIPLLKALLDENVPADVGNVFSEHGNQCVPFHDVAQRGTSDPALARIAEVTGLVLVSFDSDIRQLAKTIGAGHRRFKKLSLISFRNMRESQAAKRLAQARSLIEHEWSHGIPGQQRRLHVEIGSSFITTRR